MTVRIEYQEEGYYEIVEAETYRVVSPSFEDINEAYIYAEEKGWIVK